MPLLITRPVLTSTRYASLNIEQLSIQRSQIHEPPQKTSNFNHPVVLGLKTRSFLVLIIPHCHHQHVKLSKLRLLSSIRVCNKTTTTLPWTPKTTPDRAWCASVFWWTRGGRCGGASRRRGHARGVAAVPAWRTWRRPPGSAMFPSTGNRGEPLSALSVVPFFVLTITENKIINYIQ